MVSVSIQQRPNIIEGNRYITDNNTCWKKMVYVIRERKSKVLKVDRRLHVSLGSSMETGHERWILRMAVVGGKSHRSKLKE